MVDMSRILEGLNGRDKGRSPARKELRYCQFAVAWARSNTYAAAITTHKLIKIMIPAIVSERFMIQIKDLRGPVEYLKRTPCSRWTALMVFQMANSKCSYLDDLQDSLKGIVPTGTGLLPSLSERQATLCACPFYAL